MSGSASVFRIVFLLSCMSFSMLSSAANIEKLAKRKWIQLTTKDFQIITDLNEKKAQVLIKDIEAYRYFFNQFYGV